MYKNIYEVFNGGLMSRLDSLANANKGNRVLRSTKIEQEIFDELHADSNTLSDMEALGEKKLNTFGSLTNDIFQSFYGLGMKYVPDGELSTTAKTLNKRILSEVTADDQYGAVKAVCEGKELPSIGATEEFSETVLGQLDMVPEAATGGKGKINAMSELEQAAEKLSAELRDKLDEYQGLPEERREKAEKEVVKLANRLESKLEQSEMYGKLIEENMARKKSQIKAVISASVEKARMRGEEVKAIISAWGDGDGEMRRTPLNTEILRRVSASYKLKYIAKFLGRFKEMLAAKRTSGFTYGRGEIYDVSRGSGLHGALTSELSYLARPELMPLFFKKMQRGQIKQYRKREPECKGHGDVIVCLDESGSTFGENNAWGMAVAMLLLEMCLIGNRSFALVHFSSNTKTEIFPASEKPDAEKIMTAAETFLNGGTNFEKPLRECMRIYEENSLNKPDIVFITDGQCNVSDSLVSDFAEFKARTKTTLTGILLDRGKSFDFSLEKFADAVYRTSELCEDEIVSSLIEKRL